MNDCLKYFNGDELASSVFGNKYAASGENTPNDMHERLASEFDQALKERFEGEDLSQLPQEAREYIEEILDGSFKYFEKFKYIVPQGRVMAGLGVYDSYRSLSNCLRLPPPKDSYSSIMYSDTMLISAAKRGCGYGLGLSNLRPEESRVNNAAKSSTGAVSFMERFSFSTREVAQSGRRGACLLDIDVRHPDVIKFITSKVDRTKVTGANISVKYTDEFIECVEKDLDFVHRFPIDADISGINPEDLEYEKLTEVDGIFVLKRKAKDVFNLTVENAHDNAEPGVFFWDRMTGYDPANTYPKLKVDGCNACFTGETLIAVADGRGPIAIKELAKEGKDVPVYSIDPNTGEVSIKNGRNPRITREQADIIRVHLDNDSYLDVTPDHKFLIKSGEISEAKDLTKDDILFDFEVGTETLLNRKELVNVADYMDLHHDPKVVSVYCSMLDQGYFVKIEGDEVYVKKQCEYSGEEFWTHYLNRNISFSSWDNGLLANEKLKFNFKNYCESSKDSQVHSCKVVNIEKLDRKEDVYNITVDNNHTVPVVTKQDNGCFSGIYTMQCGEQPMAVGDTCRLILLNLFSFVKDPFGDSPSLDFDLLYKMSYIQLVLGDILVDLEIKYIDRIINKILSDPEPIEEKQVELNLWNMVKDIAISGRRVGCGITALGDMLAALNLPYDSDGALEITSKVMREKMRAEINASVDMAKMFGPFPEFNPDFELKDGIPTNDFYKFFSEEFPEEFKANLKYGRRNVNWSTIAPAGSVSILTQTTSGCECMFEPYYGRMVKINPNDKSKRVDMVDQNGDSWTSNFVVHQKLIDFARVKGSELDLTSKESIESVYKTSPYYKSTANHISWEKRVAMQAILQKYTTSAISTTLNLPSDVSKETVYGIYMQSWKMGLKGQTIYRDGCRTGVLVKEEIDKDRVAKKRPKELPADIYAITASGEKYVVSVGMLEGKPYEVFGGKINGLHLKNGSTGKLVKHKKGQYGLEIGDISIDDFSKTFTHEEQTLFRSLSTALRHGVPVNFLVEQMQKSTNNMFSLPSAIARVLKKYIQDGEKVSGAKCESCGSSNLVYKEGCVTCLDCGHSHCS